MGAALIISVFLVLATSYIIFRSKRRPSLDETHGAFSPPRPQSLFEPHHDAAQPPALSESKKAALTERAAELRRRALLGDKASLDDAHASGDPKLYHETLDALIAHADHSAEATAALASYITDSNQLRANANLAEAVIKAWESAPDRASTARMLHMAALSGDPGVLEKAVETATRFWQEGKLPQVTGEMLCALFESEYWVLAPDAARPGDNFTLRRKLAEMRRQLKADSRRAPTTAKQDG